MQKVNKIISTTFFLCIYSFLSAQVTGIVKEASSGDALIGVNILVNGDVSKGTVTDFEGKFSASADIGDELTFNYIGFEELKIQITELEMTVNLISSAELLNEVVVLGYGSSDKKDLTGVVAKINEDDFITGPINSPERLLQGKVAGLQIASSSEPGGGSNIQIRGSNLSLIHI